MILKQQILFAICLFLTLTIQAQELTVKSMKALPMDLSASTYRRMNLKGEPCGLVKVQLATAGASFEGYFIPPVEYKSGEYWVYMTQGSYELRINHPSFDPLHVNFRDYGIRDVQSLTTYDLTLIMPQAAVTQTQKLIINYTPANAIVSVDSKTYTSNGRVELTLPVGSHDYQIVAAGYNPAEGSVKLNANAPRTITENLTASTPTNAQLPTTSQQPASVQQPVKPIATNTSVETFTVNDVSFNMVRVEGGTFQMGSDDSDADSDEMPVHQVTLSTYYIGETEVTQALWEAVMGRNPSRFKGTNLPVETVSWNDCQEFIQKLNSKTGRKFRLPTEAEWEFAARGGVKNRGYKYSGSNTIGKVAWYDGNSSGETHNVKSKQSNELGLYDMSGNVWEWCQDWSDYYSSSSQTNPTGSSTGSDRVFRGGGWDGSARNCRVSIRDYYTPVNWYDNLGLRLALQ